MKKTTALSLVMCMCMTTVLIFTACKKTNDTHTHTYETTWTYNSTHHWFACEDDSCNETKQNSEHVFVDGFCAVCGLKTGSPSTGGNNGNNNSNNNSTNNNLGNNDLNNTIQTMACTYKVVSAPMNSGMIVIDSFRAGSVNYYYVDLGYAENVPIWSGMTVEYNQNQPNSPVLNFSKEMQNESTVEQSVSNTLSKTVSESFSETNSTQVGCEVGIEIDAGFLKTGTSYSASYENSRTWGTSKENQNSTTSAFSTAQNVAHSYGTSGTFTTGGCGYGYYRLSILATCDIYALMKTNVDNSQVLEITYAVCPRDNAVLSIEFSQDNTWIDNDAEKINIPQDALKRLSQPTTIYDKYVTEAYTTSTDIATISDTDSTKVFNQSGSTSFTVSVPSELERFMDLGCLYVEITATWDAKLKYRSNEYTAVATINASLNDKGYTTIGTLEATGGGWPWSYVNPAYGDEITKSSVLCESFFVTGSSMFITMDYQYIIDFSEYENWAGGTNAVTYQFDMSQIQYRFFVGEPQ